MGALAQRWANVTLRAKITAVTVFILTLGLAVAGVGTLSLLRPQLIASQDAELKRLRLDPTDALAPGADVRSLVPYDVLNASSRYYVAWLSADGEILAENRPGEVSNEVPQVPSKFITTEWAKVRGDQVFGLSGTNSTEWRAVVSPIQASNGQLSGTLVISISTAFVDKIVGQFIVIFSSFGFAVVLLGAALTRILVTTTFLPLAEVERTALEISRGDFSKRIMVASPHTEVGHLGESLNVMLDHIDASFAERAKTIEKMRRFIGDAGHELRTPLVSVRGYAELYRMGALQEEEQISQAMERIEKEAIRMTSLVEDLLSLARLDERRPLELKELSLNQLAADAALDTRAQDQTRTISVVENPANPTVLGDEHKVRQLMTNLIGNALRYSPEGSSIEIVVSASPEQGTSGFDIVDHGEGIPEQLRVKIFDRFWRADTSRNRETGGSGLGLSIVKSIVDAHDGSVEALETPGGGATFRVSLPNAAGQGASGSDTRGA